MSGALVRQPLVQALGDDTFEAEVMGRREETRGIGQEDAEGRIGERGKRQ
jgi:hypothetical protein